MKSSEDIILEIAQVITSGVDCDVMLKEVCDIIDGERKEDMDDMLVVRDAVLYDLNDEDEAENFVFEDKGQLRKRKVSSVGIYNIEDSLYINGEVELDLSKETAVEKLWKKNKKIRIGDEIKAIEAEIEQIEAHNKMPKLVPMVKHENEVMIGKLRDKIALLQEEIE